MIWTFGRAVWSLRCSCRCDFRGRCRQRPVFRFEDVKFLDYLAGRLQDKLLLVVRHLTESEISLDDNLTRAPGDRQRSAP